MLTYVVPRCALLQTNFLILKPLSIVDAYQHLKRLSLNVGAKKTSIEKELFGLRDVLQKRPHVDIGFLKKTKLFPKEPVVIKE